MPLKRSSQDILPKNLDEAKNGQPHSYSEDELCHLVINSGVVKRGSLFREIRVYLSQNDGVPATEEFHMFETGQVLQYLPFFDDFGPFNIASVCRFVEILDKQISTKTAKQRCDRHSQQHNVVYCAEPGRKALTNAAFLLGAYLILKINLTLSQVTSCFHGIDARLFEPYRDSSCSAPTFGLELIDCWQGLVRAKENGWIDTPSTDAPTLWGMIDPEEYEHYDNPMNSDLHSVIPGRLVVFGGPKNLLGATFRDNFVKESFANRDFSPEYYLDIFKTLGIVAVVRLNGTQYDKSVFESHGIRLHDLSCDPDDPVPPPTIVSRFFKIMNETNGCVAIHGKASLGRAGTLAALYLMRTYNFTAREAISWVRIMRPGSIVGVQQHYLCKIEVCIRNVLASMSVPADILADEHGRERTESSPSALFAGEICLVSGLGDRRVKDENSTAGRRTRSGWQADDDKGQACLKIPS